MSAAPATTRPSTRSAPGRQFDPDLAPLTGSVTSATTTSLTSSAVNFAGTSGLFVTITSGRGAGQVRQIQSVPTVPAGNHRINVTQAWTFNQTPNTTSTFAIVRARGIQDAINASVGIDPLPPTVGEQEALPPVNLSNAQRLIVVYPNRPGAKGFNPTGAYMENLIVPAPMTIQGVGPGGQGPTGYVYGSVVDGSSFQVKDGGAYQTAWYSLAQNIADSANNPTQISDGEVIYVLTRAGLFGQGSNPARAGIDGLAIVGGDQMSFPGGLNLNGGGPVPRQLLTLGQPVTQGGGIYVDGHARRLQIKNNAFRSDGGSYGGAIRLGSPYLGPDGNASNDNADIRVANNQIIASGGTNLAGGVGDLQRRRQLRDRPQRDLRQLLGRVRRRHLALRPFEPAGASTTTASTSTRRTTRAAESSSPGRCPRPRTSRTCRSPPAARTAPAPSRSTPTSSSRISRTTTAAASGS